MNSLSSELLYVMILSANAALGHVNTTLMGDPAGAWGQAPGKKPARAGARRPDESHWKGNARATAKRDDYPLMPALAIRQDRDSGSLPCSPLLCPYCHAKQPVEAERTWSPAALTGLRDCRGACHRRTRRRPRAAVARGSP